MSEVLHIDFFGLPGSGKSTLSHALADSLRKRGFRVKEPSYQMDHRHSAAGRKLIKMALLCYYFIFRHRTWKELDALAVRNAYSGKQRMLQDGNLVQKHLEYCKTNSGYDFCIWDQGLAQACISLSMTGRCPATENLRSLSALIPESVARQFVFVELEMPLVLERLDRKRKMRSRIELMEDRQEMEKALLAFENDCLCVKAFVNSVTVPGSSPWDEDLLSKIIKH